MSLNFCLPLMCTLPLKNHEMSCLYNKNAVLNEEDFGNVILGSSSKENINMRRN